MALMYTPPYALLYTITKYIVYVNNYSLIYVIYAEFR